MHVTVEDVPQVRVRNTGILIRIREEGGEGGGANVGKLWITQANIKWAKGSGFGFLVLPVLPGAASFFGVTAASGRAGRSPSINSIRPPLAGAISNCSP